MAVEGFQHNNAERVGISIIENCVSCFKLLHATHKKSADVANPMGQILS